MNTQKEEEGLIRKMRVHYRKMSSSSQFLGKLDLGAREESSRLVSSRNCSMEEMDGT